MGRKISVPSFQPPSFLHPGAHCVHFFLNALRHATLPGSKAGCGTEDRGSFLCCLLKMMAAAGAGNIPSTELQALQEKKMTVQRAVDAALNDLEIEEVDITLSRDGIAYLGDVSLQVVYMEGNVSNRSSATGEDWNRVLSQGLGTSFHVSWCRDNTHSTVDLRVLRLGEPIFEAMSARALNPDWDGTRAGDFTITAVDEAGAKLALAMALHSRLGSDSPLSLVSSLWQSCTRSAECMHFVGPQLFESWYPGQLF